jgi:hypothetical protein
LGHEWKVLVKEMREWTHLKAVKMVMELRAQNERVQ